MFIKRREKLCFRIEKFQFINLGLEMTSIIKHIDIETFLGKQKLDDICVTQRI